MKVQPPSKGVMTENESSMMTDGSIVPMILMQEDVGPGNPRFESHGLRIHQRNPRVNMPLSLYGPWMLVNKGNRFGNRGKSSNQGKKLIIG